MMGLISQHAEAVSFIFAYSYKMAQIMGSVNNCFLMANVKKQLGLYTLRLNLHNPSWPPQQS